jgi:CubicO group peptidase (beta-lactamase class C family)
MATFPEQAITLASHRRRRVIDTAGGENLRRARGSQRSIKDDPPARPFWAFISTSASHTTASTTKVVSLDRSNSTCSIECRVGYHGCPEASEASEKKFMFSIEAECLHLIAEAAVPGVASAIIRDGQLERYLCCGKRGAQVPAPVDEHTVFDAASLSKPVFAHAVLQLVDQEYLSLDAPLGGYLPNYVLIDDLVSSITPRHVLNHTGGLPNWRSADLPLKTYFQPGERFSYSGEGFLYLQKAVEAITGEKIHSLVERLVLRPFGMDRSSFVWDWRFEPNRAYPHDAFGQPSLGDKPGEGNAAGSLQTTAADFARFLLCVLDGSRLRQDTARSWLSPHIHVRHAKPQCLGSDDETTTGVAWGLGWGLEPEEGTFFHWGDNGAYKAFAIGSLRSRDALVFFMNGASGLSIMPDLVAAFMPGDRPSLAWLDYGRHDAPIRHLLHAARVQGVKSAWQEIENASLGADDILWIARGLTASGHYEDSIWLRARIEERWPTSVVRIS